MSGMLREHGFKIYGDTYSLGFDTLLSMGSTLNCSEVKLSPDKLREAYAGNSVANLTLREKGYKTYSLLAGYHTGIHAVRKRHLVHETYPPLDMDEIGLEFFGVLVRGILQGEFRFDTEGIALTGKATQEEVQARKMELIGNGEGKKFVVNHFMYPNHTQNSGKCLPNEKELWLKALDVALAQMEKDVSAISERDPDSIAILIGDHGPYLTGDCTVLRGWRKEDIAAELIWDRIGTMVAIRWPDRDRAEKYDRDLVLNQDIFPVVFSYLSENAEYLRLKPDRTFSGFQIKFREGRIIE